MICYVCDLQNWNEMKDMPGSTPERFLQVCKNCGNVCYKVEPEEEEKKVFEYYRKEYRPEPNITNLLTSQHKVLYVRQFLNDFLMAAKGRKLVCADIGSAIGYIPNLLRNMGHESHGCELTVSYRKFSEHFYGIPLSEEIDLSKKYDLITIYHVLEHMIEPDKKLKKYADALKDDGRIMVACPEWFDCIEEASGSAITSFEHWFHKDHINVFSRQSIKNLFWKCGLEVEKEDHVTYGQTYFLKKVAPDKTTAMTKEEWDGVVESIKKIKAAVDFYKEGQSKAMNREYDGGSYLDALAIWPKFPDVYLNLIFNIYLKLPEKQVELFDQALKLMPDNIRLHIAKATWHYQRQEYEKCLEHCGFVMNHRPNEDILIHMGWCFWFLNKPRDCMKAMVQAAEWNPTKWPEAMNWACKAAASMPSWDEVAREKIKESLYEKSGEVVNVPDKRVGENAVDGSK